jgi:N-acetylmuramoyl-L-alanine amidase
MARKINWVIVHQSASSNPAHHNLETIEKWHKARGFAEIGYHFLVHPDGTIIKGRDENKIGAHCKNHNKDSLGICLLGLFDIADPEKQPSEAQLNSLEILLIDLLSRYDLNRGDILGHRDLAPTLCPGFDLDAWLKTREWE